MLEGTLEGSGKGPPDAGNSPAPAASAAPSASVEPSRVPGIQAALAGDERPHATVAVKLATTSSQRGASIQMTGSVEAAGEPCTYSRIDVSLRDGAGVEAWLGAFPTDANGNFEGHVTVPFDIDVGDYKVIARTPGTGRCGASR
jgi:hypothetical protein